MNTAHSIATQALQTYRKTDAVFIVCQDNVKKTLEIMALNEEASRITGYGDADLVGQPLEKILPARIRETVRDYVEFEEEGRDLLAVFTKQRDFAIVTRNGNDLAFKLRIVRGDTVERNPLFHLVLVDEGQLQKRNAFREILKENFKGHEELDEKTGFPNRISIIKDLELMIYYTRHKDITASFAILDINDFDRIKAQYGQKTCERLHQHIGSICKQKLRLEDTVGTLSERSLAVLLVDAVQEPARMVLNRLRWMISVSPFLINAKDELLAQVNISFAQVDGKTSNTELLEHVERFMQEQRRTSVNSIQLVLVPDRRGKTDRRKQDIPVEVERRKADRRTQAGGQE